MKTYKMRCFSKIVKKTDIKIKNINGNKIYICPYCGYYNSYKGVIEINILKIKTKINYDYKKTK